MAQEINLVVSPDVAASPKKYTQIAADKLHISVEQIANVRIVRKSIDARTKKVKVNLSLLVFSDDEREPDKIEYNYQNVSSAPEVIVVGSGPAGLFAALRLIELGYKPIVLERGKDVSARKIDIAAANRNQPINPESNYCFGEGGAGTYSDGKLFTRSKKRGNYRKTLEIFHNHGASEDILYEAHPHIGTDVLPRIIRSMREQIIEFGGEVRFGMKVVDFIIKDDKILGVVCNEGEKISGIATILATGHSARDIYHTLNNKKIALEAKPFAMGVRVEHPQALIDSIQYSVKNRGPYLPPATYSLVAQVEDRGVYSFCMCPGGFIVPAATADGESVVNGMSPNGRNSVFANSGIVTEIREKDYAHLIEEYGVLAGLAYQQQLENLAYQNGGGAQKAPAHRLADFVAKRASHNLPNMSYVPKGEVSDMNLWLPESIGTSLRNGFKSFEKKMKGFVTNEAVILGVESRTSSPVRIPRNPETLAHIQIEGLFPCGEGAGYAGGIISAAVDGERVAESISMLFPN